jgi:hypothetical protein
MLHFPDKEETARRVKKRKKDTCSWGPSKEIECAKYQW